MANELCECATGLSNTGLPLCEQIFKVAKKVIFVSASSGGVLMSVDPTSTLNKAWIDALLNNSTKTLRWYPTPELKNVDMPKGDPMMESFEDKSSIFISEDVRKFTAIIPECPPRYKAVLESVRCNSDTMIYIVDKNDNLIGLTNGIDNLLYPMPINVQSMVGKVVMGTDKATTQMLVGFEFPTTLQDSKIRMISGDNFTDFSMQSISGLRDVNARFFNISTTQIVVDLTVKVSDLSAPVKVEGLVITDFISNVGGATSRCYNFTTSTNITITSVTEDVPGIYILAFAAQTSDDEVIVNVKSNGYDFTSFKNTVNVIP